MSWAGSGILLCLSLLSADWFNLCGEACTLSLTVLWLCLFHNEFCVGRVIESDQRWPAKPLFLPDIPNDLDDLWTLDIKKSHAIPPAEVRNNLQIVIDRIADKSKRTWTFRGKKETSDTVEHIWTRLKTPGSGVAYEINRDHPLVDQIIADVPEARTKLESLLRYIERSIPLNQLYVDLNNDEKIENDTEIEEAEMQKTLEQMLSAVPSSILRLEMLERLEHTEPFCLYPDVLHDLKAEEES